MEFKAKRHFSSPAHFAMLSPSFPSGRQKEKVHGPTSDLLLCSYRGRAFVPLGAAQATDDGIVKFKSAYSMPETIERMKKDIADKGIMFFDEIDQAKLAADAGITLCPRPCSCSAIRRSGLRSSPLTPIPGSTGRCGCWSTRTPRATCGSPIRISPGSPPRHHQPRQGIQDGLRGDCLHHLDRAEIASKPRGGDEQDQDLADLLDRAEHVAGLSADLLDAEPGHGKARAASSNTATSVAPKPRQTEQHDAEQAAMSALSCGGRPHPPRGRPGARSARAA